MATTSGMEAGQENVLGWLFSDTLALGDTTRACMTWEALAGINIVCRGRIV